MKKYLLCLAISLSFLVTLAQSTFDCGTSIVTDADGYQYHTVKMGLRCWLKENMRSTHYSNGLPVGIPKYKPSYQTLINLSGKIRLKRYFPKEEQVSVDIYNMDGESVYNTIIQVFAGYNLIDISAGPLGLYLLTMRSDVETFNIKVTGSDQTRMEVSVQQLSCELKLSSNVANVNDLNPRYYYDYDNDPDNDEKFGKLYTSASALNVDYTAPGNLEKVIQGICPDGWHVSNDTDWRQLEITIGIPPNIVNQGIMFQLFGNFSYKLTTPDTAYWSTSYGTDEFGFSARGAGGYWPHYGEGFTELKNRSSWLTYNSEYGILILQITSFENTFLSTQAYPIDAHSVRCVKNY